MVIFIAIVCDKHNNLLDSLLRSSNKYMLNACYMQGGVLSTMWDIIIHKTQIPQSRTSKSGKAKSIHTQMVECNRESVEHSKNNNTYCWGRRQRVTWLHSDSGVPSCKTSTGAWFGRMGWIWKWREGIKDQVEQTRAGVKAQREKAEGWLSNQCGRSSHLDGEWSFTRQRGEWSQDYAQSMLGFMLQTIFSTLF